MSDEAPTRRRRPADAGATVPGARADAAADARADARGLPAEEAVLRPPAPDLAAVGAALGDAEPPAPTDTRRRPAVGPAVAPLVEGPSPDVAAVPAASRIPGTHRPGYTELPTAPVVTAPAPDAGDDAVEEWQPAAPAPAPARAALGPWALGLAIVALAASVFVGWMLPLGLIAAITALVALRRPHESRRVAVWALALGAVAMLYSAGWLLYALPQL
jgi:hypothetical protein